jgi:plasmid stabilization system protein ParE
VWPVRFTEAARAELIDAQDWYEAQAPGLDRRFRAEIDSVVRRMADNPRNSPSSPQLSGVRARRNFPTRSTVRLSSRDVSACPKRGCLSP